MKTTDQILGANIKRLRELFKETQETFALNVEVSRSALANYEAGTREIPNDVIEKAALFFGCEPHVLFDETLSDRKDILICAFRVDGVCGSDREEINRFKDVVRSYLKMKSIGNG